jgi:hypothetical protein
MQKSRCAAESGNEFPHSKNKKAVTNYRKGEVMLAPFLLIGCVLAGEPVHDEALATGALKAEVQRLKHDLDDDSKAVRAKAEARLVELGPAVLDLLPEPDPKKSDEASQAVRRIRQTLQQNQARASVQRSTLTLHGRMKISRILAEIQKQTGNAIGDLPRTPAASIPDPEFTVEFDKTPFWTGLDSLLDQAQLSVYPYGQPKGLQIVPRGPADLPRTGRAALSGPFRIEPVRVVAKRELRSSSPSGLQVALEVAWEPRLRPISIKQRMADLKVVDSNGNSLAAEDAQAEKEAYPGPGNSAVELDIALAMPKQPVKQIASLKGALRAIMLGKTETFKFTDLLKGKQEKRIGAAIVTVDEVRKNGDAWEVFVRLSFDSAGDALESHRNWVVQNEAFLEDEMGKAIQPDSMETTSRTEKEIGMGYVFGMADLPKNASFVYKTPGVVVTNEYPYEVRGVKMP